MKEAIDKSLEAIFNDLQHIPDYDHGLLQASGRLLFLAEYARYTSRTLDREIAAFTDTINNYEVSDTRPQTFAEGYPGMNMILRHLARLGFIAQDEETDEAIEDIAIVSGRHQLALRNFDLLYGATGLLHYLVRGHSSREAARNFYAAYLDSLEENALDIHGGTAWEDYYYRIRENGTGINMGLAHGVPATLKALLQMIPLVAQDDLLRVRSLIRSTCQFLIHSRNSKAGALSRYGGYFIPGGPEEISRLGWCYGDLSVAIILYQAGKLTGDLSVCSIAEDIAAATMVRQQPGDTMITDAGLCHGSAGVAHIYNKLWQATGQARFREAADFWIGQTLAQATHADGIGGYKKYNPLDKGYQTDAGFLEGAAGVGLALLSHITGQSAWDDCLMLNDC